MVNQGSFAFLLMVQIAYNWLIWEATAGGAKSKGPLAYKNKNLRIFDGDILTNAVPYIAQIRVSESQEISHSFVLCGATVLTDRHLLTAAQCFDIAYEGHFFFAVFNASDIHTNFDILSYQEFGFQAGIKHPEYRITDTELIVNDVAIVTLPERIDLACGITTVCLDGSKKLHHKNLFAAGWGRVNCHFNARYLLFSTARTLSNDKCKETASNSNLYAEISDSHYCTDHFPNGQTVKTAPDEGDYGGPLISYSFGNQDVQVGVLSGNNRIDRILEVDILSRCSDTDKPTLSMRVSSYKSFILEHAPEARFCGN